MPASAAAASSSARNQASGSGPSSLTDARRSPTSLRRPRGNGSSSSARVHHPFRLEVQEVTPVSISLRWSLRPPPISQLRLQSNNRDEAAKKTRPELGRKGASSSDHDQEDWPSDEGATAVNEDGSDRDLSDVEGAATNDLLQSTRSSTAGNKLPSTISKTFNSGVSVVLNGSPWSQVVMGDKGPDEAVIVVYGLKPGQEYELELTVGEAAQDEDVPTISARFSTANGSSSGTDSAGISTPDTRELIGNSVDGAQRNISPSRLLSESSLPSSSSLAPAVPEVSQADAAEAEREALTAELRQARKEASKAEQALRNDIEAIKRAMDRTQSVDHRSKQKVLALQESIRQTNQSAKDIAEEAEAVEGEHADWESKASTTAEEESTARSAVEAKEEQASIKVKADEELTAAAEKELAAIHKTLTSKESEVQKLREGKVADLESEIARLEAEIDRVKNAPTPPLAHTPRLEASAAPFQPSQGGLRSVSGPTGGRGGRGDRNQQRAGGGGAGPAMGGSKAAGAHRNASGGQYHRRGRGGAMPGAGSGGSSIGSHGPPGHLQQSTNMGVHGGMGHLPPHMAGMSADPFGGQGNYAHYGSDGFGQYLNGPYGNDYHLPGSAQGSPVLSRRNLPQVGPPQGPGHLGGSAWGSHNDFTSHLGAAAAGSRYPYINDSSPGFGSAGYSRDSPTSAATFAQQQQQPPIRRRSIGSDDDLDDIFDPTATGPPPPHNPSPTTAQPYLSHQASNRAHFDFGGSSSGFGSNMGSSNMNSRSSPWLRPSATMEQQGGSPLVGAHPSSSLSPWASSSPILQTGASTLTGHGPVAPESDIWSSSPSSSLHPSASMAAPNSSSTQRPVRSHPSLLTGSASIFRPDVSHRASSGSSGSGGQAGSTPTSPSMPSNRGCAVGSSPKPTAPGFGAIGGRRNSNGPGASDGSTAE